jgi:hypothetical protein
MRWTRVVTSVLGVLGLGAIPSGPATAQSRVIVPIVIQAPRAGAPSATGTPTVRVTTRTTSPQPGVTATRVTVTNTTGAGRAVGVAPTTQTRTTVPVGTPSVLVTVDRRAGPDGSGTPGQTRVTVRDVSQSGRTLGGPPAISMLQAAGRGQETFIITSEAPIDAPIVILAP